MAAYDRSVEDIGNIVGLDHINTRIADQRLATAFYIMGLGLTRDPYLVTGISNMWINAGLSQFHLPTGEPQVLRGTTGLVVPDLEALARRLDDVGDVLANTQFAVRRAADAVEVTSPWGNRFRCHAPGPDFGEMTLGVAYVAFDVPAGASGKIGDFYRQVMGARCSQTEFDGVGAARVQAGNVQEMIFCERDQPAAEFDGHHVAIFIHDFSGPYNWLLERGLISQESNQHQYRFVDIVDPKSDEVVFQLDHEVRSMCHPFYRRALINRNAGLSQAVYTQGHDDQPAWVEVSTN